MKFAILAAGKGSRLSQEGILPPKPLVQINGITLIDRLIHIFTENKAEEIIVITNREAEETWKHLENIQKSMEIPLKLIIKTTPSSMHSFHALSHYLQEGHFCLTTVDTIFCEQEFNRFIETFEKSKEDGLMAVTDYIDDEKPLYIATNEQLDITGFYDEARPDTKYISGGIYGLTPKAIGTLNRCIEQGMSRMRNFQRQLVTDGFKLKAYPFSKILDIDHASDITKAESFLNEKKDTAK